MCWVYQRKWRIWKQREKWKENCVQLRPALTTSAPPHPQHLPKSVPLRGPSCTVSVSSLPAPRSPFVQEGSRSDGMQFVWQVSRIKKKKNPQKECFDSSMVWNHSLQATSFSASASHGKWITRQEPGRRSVETATGSGRSERLASVSGTTHAWLREHSWRTPATSLGLESSNMVPSAPVVYLLPTHAFLRSPEL